VPASEGGNVYLAGVDPKDVGAIRRQDGQVQITVGGTWFAVGPTGEKATS